MPAPRYTAAEILSLADSPLIRKPENLPPIEQWIDQEGPAQRNKGRGQAGFPNGKGDENEHPAKRPSPFEARQSYRQTNTGEEIFLGPKISFASASASRQPNKNGTADDRSAPPTQDPKTKQERLSGTEKNAKTRNGRAAEVDSQRSRWKQDWKSNRPLEEEDEGQNDEITSNRAVPPMGKWKSHTQERNDSEGPSEGNDRRNASGRNYDAEAGRSWRGKDWRGEREMPRGGRFEQDPQWMKESLGGDEGDHTQEDFQKWKESMKLGTSGATDAAVKEMTLAPEEPSAEPAQSAVPKALTTLENGNKDNLFGMWGESKDGKKQEKNTSAKAKSSRFAGFFAPAQQDVPRPQEPASPEPQSPPPANLTKTTTEDQEGFQKMMEMLRMGPKTSQPPTTSAFGPGPADGNFESYHSPPQHELHQRSNSFLPEEHERVQQPLSPPSKLSTFPQSPIATEGVDSRPRPEPTKRDSEFLMNLMSQQRAPFSESQIYGQIYNRGNNMASPIDAYGGRQPPPKGAFPPGFHSNEAAFQSNRDMDGRYMRGPPITSPVDRFGGPPNLMSEFSRAQQPPPNFDQPPWQHDRTPSQSQSQHEGAILPPPGFPAAGRGQAPPGFFGFPNNGPPQGMRGPPPPPMSQQPPGFYNGPGSPLGFPGQPPPGMNMQQSRRPSQPPPGPPPPGMQPPAGFGGSMGQQQPPPMQQQHGPPQGQYGQYFKQGGGGMY